MSVIPRQVYGKWGVIDTKGNVVINPSYSEMIVIPDNTKPVFLVIDNVNYENGTYTAKAINEKNEAIFTNYDKVEPLYNYDENNSLNYESVLKVQKDGKYGLIGYDGKEVLACLKDNIEVLVGTKSVYVTTLNGKKGIVNNVGKEIIENKYADISSLTNKYENGFIVKNDAGKLGIVKYNGTTALEEKYDEIKNVYGNGLYVVKENNAWKVINENLEVILDSDFDDVKTIDSDNILISKGNKYGVIGKDKEEVIPVNYDDLEYAFGDYYIAKKENKYGIISIDNKEVVEFKYNNISYIADAGFIRATKENAESDLLDKDFKVKATGIVAQINNEKNYIRLRVNDEYKYLNFKLEEKKNTEILSTNTIFLSKKDGKYGYVNEKGIVVVDYIYEDATEQNKYGYVSVKKDGKWGALDSKGKVIVEPKYKLENSIVVDFISTWHLATDVNANYYTK